MRKLTGLVAAGLLAFGAVACQNEEPMDEMNDTSEDMDDDMDGEMEDMEDGEEM